MSQNKLLLHLYTADALAADGDITCEYDLCSSGLGNARVNKNSIVYFAAARPSDHLSRNMTPSPC